MTRPASSPHKYVAPSMEPPTCKWVRALLVRRRAAPRAQGPGTHGGTQGALRAPWGKGGPFGPPHGGPWGPFGPPGPMGRASRASKARNLVPDNASSSSFCLVLVFSLLTTCSRARPRCYEWQQAEWARLKIKTRKHVLAQRNLHTELSEFSHPRFFSGNRHRGASLRKRHS